MSPDTCKRLLNSATIIPWKFAVEIIMVKSLNSCYSMYEASLCPVTQVEIAINTSWHQTTPTKPHPQHHLSWLKYYILLVECRTLWGEPEWDTYSQCRYTTQWVQHRNWVDRLKQTHTYHSSHTQTAHWSSTTREMAVYMDDSWGILRCNVSVMNDRWTYLFHLKTAMGATAQQ